MPSSEQELIFLVYYLIQTNILTWRCILKLEIKFNFGITISLVAAGHLSYGWQMETPFGSLK